MEWPDTESRSRGIISILRGERIRDRIDLPPPPEQQPPHSLPRKLNTAAHKRLRETFAEQQSPGEAGRINWREVGVTAIVWLVLWGVVVALLYFCYTLVRFAFAL